MELQKTEHNRKGKKGTSICMTIKSRNVNPLRTSITDLHHPKKGKLKAIIMGMSHGKKA